MSKFTFTYVDNENNRGLLQKFNSKHKAFFYIFFSFQFFNNYERLYFTAHVIEECVCVFVIIC